MRVLACLVVLSLLLATGACRRGEVREDGDPPVATRAPPETALQPFLAGAWRSEANRARDAWRHPAQTLAFFGVEPTHRVVEITPGAGWYSEILAPYLRERGHYTAAVLDPARLVNEGSRPFYQRLNEGLAARFAADPERYDRAEVLAFDPAAPFLGPPVSADRVLTFRNVHNWVSGGYQAQMFEAFFEVLRPGGVLGVVEHRALPGSELAAVQASGYIPEEAVIAMALRAGFVLEARSEINANPADDRQHPNGVWTLPPTLRVPEGEDPAGYRAIGESDRMTLRFVKPGT
jgi:predicted methyltransferase